MILWKPMIPIISLSSLTLSLLPARFSSLISISSRTMSYHLPPGSNSSWKKTKGMLFTFDTVPAKSSGPDTS